MEIFERWLHIFCCIEEMLYGIVGTFIGFGLTSSRSTRSFNLSISSLRSANSVNSDLSTRWYWLAPDWLLPEL